jgi:hypothetical protein
MDTVFQVIKDSEKVLGRYLMFTYNLPETGNQYGHINASYLLLKYSIKSH